MIITHGECGKQWTGSSRAHCAACHLTFASDAAAEKHRVGKFGVDRRCEDPATMKDKDEHAKFIPHTTPLGVIWHTAPPAGGFTFFRDED